MSTRTDSTRRPTAVTIALAVAGLQALLGALGVVLIFVALEDAADHGQDLGGLPIVVTLAGLATLGLLVAVVIGIVRRASWVTTAATVMLAIQVLGLLFGLISGGMPAGAIGVGLSGVVLNRLRTPESCAYLESARYEPRCR